MKSPLILCVLLAVAVVSEAQDHLPTNDEESLQLVPGLYLSFEDFIYNDPVDFEQVEGDLDRFINDLNYDKEVTITKNNSVNHVSRNNVWGYSDGNDVYLNRSLFSTNLKLPNLQMKATPWLKIVTIGTLSLASFAMAMQTKIYSTTIQSNFILNTKDGKVYDADLKELQHLISDDPELLREFEKARGDKEIKFFTFLRKYNEQHPFHFR
jgi:hypothetical protein